ncbi:hypothetical protein HZH68_016251 [Vespula germanica]|uniref:Uncharacterized protein n=1 Tax=Vespula germanica TaxID=30212 RepID=A0A834J7D9_VESGE|nr:hypothetical protein HZH68_016251 [Vespula germanica]
MQITVDSAPSQHIKSIGTAFASVLSSASLEEFTNRTFVRSHDRPSIVHSNYAVIKGNTVNHRAGISSKAFLFETSSLSLTFPRYHVQYRVRQLIDIKGQGKEEDKSYNGHEHKPSRDRYHIYFNAMGEIGNVKDNPGAIKKDSKKEDLLIHVEEEKEEKADTEDEDVQGECKDYLSTLAHDLMENRFYLDDIKEKTENDIENRKGYENGRFNHELHNELIKIEIILR